ncbi:hypothetical protein F4V58_07865 [Corynebacterium phocae]|nr:hypothetical protein [Corynebacterium phocae]KAA8723221.1 hypothetical protein F4V58_07865 [Corynebacterium phocae]
MRDALLLREKGLSYARIAEEIGVSSSQAYEDVQDALEEITREPAEHVLVLELQRIDRMWEACYKKALGGDINAMAQALKLMSMRLKLNGLERINVRDNTADELQAEKFRIFDAISLEDLGAEE